MYGKLGSMAQHRFIYIRQMPGVYVLRLMALYLCYNSATFGGFYLPIEHSWGPYVRPPGCPSNKGGVLEDYGTFRNRFDDRRCFGTGCCDVRSGCNLP